MCEVLCRTVPISYELEIVCECTEFADLYTYGYGSENNYVFMPNISKLRIWFALLNT